MHVNLVISQTFSRKVLQKYLIVERDKNNALCMSAKLKIFFITRVVNMHDKIDK